MPRHPGRARDATDTAVRCSGLSCVPLETGLNTAPARSAPAQAAALPVPLAPARSAGLLVPAAGEPVRRGWERPCCRVSAGRGAAMRARVLAGLRLC